MVNIIGAGLAGLSCAVTLAQRGIPVRLIASQPSERAQSVLAEGGINGALNVMGEDDSPEQHAADTRKAGADIADPAAVDDLCRHAPEILAWFQELGVPFNQENGQIIQRNFGGQKKKRTAFAKSSTGRVLMNALISACRQYEAAGQVQRFSHHDFEDIALRPDGAAGVWVRDQYTQEILYFGGPVVICTGGLNGFFPGRTTGTTADTGEAAARLFLDGVRMSNLEMIQFHPTTAGIAGKRCLVSEAARGEGGRLFLLRDGQPWFFMEEKYPELGNLMPRDVISREMVLLTAGAAEAAPADPGTGKQKKSRKARKSADYSGCRPGQVYLELRHLPAETWSTKLPDLREELIHYLHLDPAREPVPVEPGIHYFMGGIDVDSRHRTNIPGLYAAGECTSQYHGANRLGGNSTLGAVYGGITAAETAAAELDTRPAGDCPKAGRRVPPQDAGNTARAWEDRDTLAGGAEAAAAHAPADPGFVRALGEILYGALGIVRDHETLQAALDQLDSLERADPARLALAEAMLRSADFRQESRGAHFRADFPEQDAAYRGMTTALYSPAGIEITLRPAGDRQPDGTE